MRSPWTERAWSYLGDPRGIAYELGLGNGGLRPARPGHGGSTLFVVVWEWSGVLEAAGEGLIYRRARGGESVLRRRHLAAPGDEMASVRGGRRRRSHAGAVAERGRAQGR